MINKKYPDTRLNKYTKLAIIAGLIVIIDQITKAAILHFLPLHESVPVISGFFSLTHIHNQGGAFGFLADQSSVVRGIVFLLISGLAICLIFYFYAKTPKTHHFLTTGFAFVLGGATGNMIDRIRFGKVVDFLDFFIKELHWPAFNVADSAITTGMTIFVIHLLFNKLPE
jgi:signal peptidase II